MAPLFTGLRLGFGRSADAGGITSLPPLKLVLGDFGSSNVLLYNSVGDTLTTVSVASGSIRQLAFNNSGYVSVLSDGTVYQSTNQGSSWSQINANIGLTPPSGAAYASQAGETIINNNSGYTPPIRRSTDGGTNWSSDITLSIASYGVLVSASKVGSNWYYTGRYEGGVDVGGIWKSTDDGASWTLLNTFSNGLTQGKVVYLTNASKYLAAYYSYGISYQKPIYSSDGTSWTNPGAGGGETFAVNHDLATNGTIVIGTANGSGLYQSTDGISWSSIDLSYLSGLTNHHRITYNSVVGFVVQSPLYILRSMDGIIWTKTTIAATGDYRYVSPLIIPG